MRKYIKKYQIIFVLQAQAHLIHNITLHNLLKLHGEETQQVKCYSELSQYHGGINFQSDSFG